MFNLTKREKALRTIVLDEAINASNLDMFEDIDGGYFLEAIAIDTDLELRSVKKKISSSEGLSLKQYPGVRILVERAIAFYGEGK